jgi:hypothetical protein
MDRSGLVWIGAILVALVFLDLLFVELRRIFREGKRIVTRLEAYGELPIFAALAGAERDAERIAEAFEALEPLLERWQLALGVLRRYLPKGSSPG